MDAKSFIDNIKSQIESSNQIVLKSLSGAIDRLQKAFPRYESFLMEFLQNADDEKSTKFFVRLTKDKLIISNDGNPFTESNIQSLCTVGNSDKSLDNYIGYLGVGFKSVFLISNFVKVVSSPYSFSFSKFAWNQEKFPWQVTPIWEEDGSGDEDNTKFIIEIKSEKFVDRLQNELTEAHISNRILLFLKNIQSISLINEINKTERHFSKSLQSQNPDYSIWTIKENQLNENWLVIKDNILVPDEVKEDQITIDWERSNVKVREISAVFKLDSSNNLVPEIKATAHIGVFSFIPLREIESGLKFLIQADFITNLGRGDIDRASKWNNWIATQLFDLIIQKCIPIFKNSENWKLNFTNILFSASTNGHSLFIEKIILPLKAYLENENVFLTEGNIYVKKDDIVWLDAEFIDLLDDGDWGHLYPQKYPLHRNCKTYLNDYSRKIASSEYDPFSYLKFGQKLFEFKIDEKRIEWFLGLYAFVLKKYDRSYFRMHHRYNVKYKEFWDRIALTDQKIIPTLDYKLTSPSTCFENTNNVEIPGLLQSNINLPHPLISVNSNFSKFSKLLKSHNKNCFKELNDRLVRQKLIENDEIIISGNEWLSKSSEEKIEYINLLIPIHQKIDLSKFNFITLPSKNDDWLKPDELLFATEYESEKHRLEELCKIGLIDFPLQFLSLVFIQHSDQINKTLVKSFFLKLGVDKKSEDKNLIERIAIRKTLEFEKNENRTARELAGSDKPGYDIISQSQDNKKRLIEVKGSAKSQPEIYLSVNEYLTLKKESELYYVYVVSEALKNPVISVLAGSDLNKIDETKVSFAYNKWYPTRLNK